MAKSTMQGIEQLEVNLKKVVGVVSGNSLARSLEAGYLVWEGEAKILINTSPASGRTYGGHKASAPGEPPATDTGALVNDWPRPQRRSTSRGAEVEGGPGQESAKYLELGTKHMDARPFMRPALDENKPKITRAVQMDLNRKIEAAL